MHGETVKKMFITYLSCHKRHLRTFYSAITAQLLSLG